MPVTQVSIANRALIRCGADRISSITQDTRGAVLCNALYDQTRDSVLRAHPWNFAIMRVELAPTADTPAWGYDFEYELPSDCLRVLEPVCDVNGLEPVDHVVECDADGNARVIRTDESVLLIRYMRRHVNEADWDPNFADAFAWKLASEISYALTQSIVLRDSCEKSYRLVMAEARSMDAVEGNPPAFVADIWTRARR